MSTRPPRQTEADLVFAIKQTLSLLGFEVLACGQGVVRSAGSTPGLPDLWIRNPRRVDLETDPIWLAMEVKLPKGTLSPAQQRLHDEGSIVVVRTVEQAARSAVKALGFANDCRPDWALEETDRGG
jgi:hypothetical protein